jgi:hypothetical protein
MTNQDKMGVYKIGDLKFHSKLEAIEMHAKTGIHPHWDFNEAVFSSYDWTKEPETPILELYRQRAQQIRDQYDYVILNYSSGADSQTVLNAFVNNDIRLDEVVSFVNYRATGDHTNVQNREIVEVAIPRIKQLQETKPWLRHRIIDFTDVMIDYFETESNRFDWIYQVNMILTPIVVAKQSFVLKQKQWADMIHAGKKLCVIYGADKPRIHHVAGKFCVRFQDTIGFVPDVTSMAGLQPYTDELFFWTPDKPEIVIKQAHLVKQYLSAPNVQNLPCVSLGKTDLAYRVVNGQKYGLSNDGLHALIYPEWDPGQGITAAKPRSIIFADRDEWFFQLESTNPLLLNWQFGLEKVWKTIPDYWKNDPGDIAKGLKGSVSKNYFLE